MIAATNNMQRSGNPQSGHRRGQPRSGGGRPAVGAIAPAVGRAGASGGDGHGRDRCPGAAAGDRRVSPHRADDSRPVPAGDRVGWPRGPGEGRHSRLPRNNRNQRGRHSVCHRAGRNACPTERCCRPSASFARRKRRSSRNCSAASGRKRLPWCSRTCRPSGPARCWRVSRRRCKSRSSAAWWTWKTPTRKPCARWSKRWRRGWPGSSPSSAAARPGRKPWRESSPPVRRHVVGRILDNLAEFDRALAEQLGRRPMEFDDLAQLDDATLWAVFRAAEPEVALLALLGAPPPLVERILAGMSAREGKEPASQAGLSRADPTERRRRGAAADRRVGPTDVAQQPGERHAWRLVAARVRLWLPSSD